MDTATPPTAVEKAPHEALRAFLDEHDLNLSEAARALHCSHPALLDWLGGKSPSEPYRLAIETWTGGRIKACAWPLQGREARLVAKLAPIVPHVPPAPEPKAA